MFTIFSCPKEFTSLFGIIQRNALNSWLNLNPIPKIILFGVENEEIKKEYYHEAISSISIEDLNEYNTPYINKIFEEQCKNNHRYLILCKFRYNFIQ